MLAVATPGQITKLAAVVLGVEAATMHLYDRKLKESGARVLKSSGFGSANYDDLSAARLFIAGIAQPRPSDVVNFVRTYGSLKLGRVSTLLPATRRETGVRSIEQKVLFESCIIPGIVQDLPEGTTFEETVASIFRSIRTGEFGALQSGFASHPAEIWIELMLVEPHPYACVSFYLNQFDDRRHAYSIGHFGDAEQYGIDAQLAGRVGAVRESKVAMPAIMAVGEALRGID